MAAVLSSELHNTDKILIFIAECRRMGLVITNPDVNQGQYRFTVNKQGQIVYGLGAIKGLGEGPLEAILEARAAGGDFTDLFDFCARVDQRRTNKRALEGLIKAGAFDSLGESRAILMAALTDAVQSAEQQNHNSALGMVDLFASDDEQQLGDVYANFRHLPELTFSERLAGEKATLGLYLTGHPMDEFADDLQEFKCRRINSLIADSKEQWVGGMISAIRDIRTKRGDRLKVVSLDDGHGQIDVTIFAKVLIEVQDKIKPGAVIFVQGKVEEDSFSGGLRMRAETIANLLEMRSRSQRKVCIHIDADNWHSSSRAMLESLLIDDAEQGCEVSIRYTQGSLQAQLRLGHQWRILPDEETLLQLKRVFGMESVSFIE